MSQQEEDAILKAILASSSTTLGPNGPIISTEDRQQAFQVLSDFKKYDRRIPMCLRWLQLERIAYPMDATATATATGAAVDISVSTKLYALELVQDLIHSSYRMLNDNDRIALRQAIVTAARHHAPSVCGRDGAARILGNKLAALLASLVVRDFPQRWTTLMDDVFSPMAQGGLWYNSSGDVANGAGAGAGAGTGLAALGTDAAGFALNYNMGVKICLECLNLIAEDCTDSDFNSKISTKRRNDVLIGLNEVSSVFLPRLFRLLEHIAVIAESKARLHQMRLYLRSNQQTIQSMTPDQATAYHAESDRVAQLSLMIADSLSTFEHFCRSMPLDWLLSSGTDTTAPSDVVAAFFHLIRERNVSIQLIAVECLEQLLLRGKLSPTQWLRFLRDFPEAISEANRQFEIDKEYAAVEVMFSNASEDAENVVKDPLAAQLNFHRSLSRTLSTVVNSHLSLVTSDKSIVQCDNTRPNAALFSSFLRLLVDLLHHPSGRICGEQINLWISLLRDPQISKGKQLQPFIQEIISCYMDHMVRIRWEDVDEQTHPLSILVEASWDDEDEYNSWIMDIRSKASLLFKFIGNCEPHIACSTLCTRIQSLIAVHGNGEPRDHLDPTNQQLTQNSDAVRLFEGVAQPMEYILSGIPSWALQTASPSNNSDDRALIRAATQAAASELARIVVGWNPPHVWLKFRRAQLLDSLKHYWKYDPSTLLQGIDSLLGYLRAPDEWRSGNTESSEGISGEVVGLRKKSSTALVAVAKTVPHHLVPWLSQLSQASRPLFSSPDLLPATRMHLYEFLSCVVTAVEDPVQRSSFISDVLADAVATMELPEVQEGISSVESFLSFIGAAQAASRPESVTNVTNVQNTSMRFSRMFSSFNQLLSVGKRCYEAACKRPGGGIPGVLSEAVVTLSLDNIQNFPDEGPISIRDLAINDPFVPLWPRILPNLLKILDVLLRLWHPEYQAILLPDRIQRYILAISDDDAFLSKRNDGKQGGVFGEGGTAGSIIPGTDRRDTNLAPRWSSWLSEFRVSCFQMLGLLAAQRVLFAPEVSELFPQIIAVVVDVQNLRAMEHRHMVQYLKQFIELLLLNCPSTMYMTHLAPIIGPVLEHMQYRLEKTWQPIIGRNPDPQLCKPFFANDCSVVAAVASRGGEEWFASYYARAGIFVGDLDVVTAEAAVEKGRVEVTRVFSDVMQSALALKGDWALVLANLSKEDQANKAKDSTKLLQGPRNRITEGQVNADGTPKVQNQSVIDARKLKRISALCHFLFLEHEQIAASMTLNVINCLSYPDAYTCRRMTRICHRLLETVAWHPRYTELLGSRLLAVTVSNIVKEPKWMVGVEWDVINVIRDLYGRLVLGQMLQIGGQGAAQQQLPSANNPNEYEQSKTADRPLQGGGILTTPSDLPRQLLASLPGINMAMVLKLDQDLKQKRSAKDQKDIIRDLLRIAADTYAQLNPNEAQSGSSAAAGALDRADQQESLLHNAHKKADVDDIPEKLITHSMIMKRTAKNDEEDAAPQGLALFSL